MRGLLSSLWARARSALPLLCLAASWLALRRGFFSRVDIPLWDETEYLATGWRLLHHADASTILPGSPLYLVWYAIWHALIRNPFTVLVAQWLLVDLCIALVIYLILRRRGAGAWLAYLGAAYWSVLAFTWDVPRVGFLAFLLVLLAVLAEDSARPRWTFVLLAAAALIRPEDALPLALWLGLRGWPRLPRRRRLAVLIGIPVLAVLALAIVGPARLGGGRVWTAFGQHYSLRWAAAHPGAGIDPWVDWESVATANFPGAHSLGAACLINGAEVLRHLVRNLADLPGVLVGLVASPLLPGNVLGPAILVALLLAIAVRRNWPSAVGWRPSPLLLVACASVLPSFLVKPKAVYLLPLLLVILFGILRAARSLAGQARLAVRFSGGLCAAVTLLLWLVPAQPAVQRPVSTALASVLQVWQAQPGANWRMLEADGGWCAYVDLERCTSLWLGRKPHETPFGQYLAEVRANAVLVSEAFRRDVRVRNDDEWKRFVRDPASFGFRLTMTNPGYALYLGRSGYGEAGLPGEQRSPTTASAPGTTTEGLSQ